MLDGNGIVKIIAKAGKASSNVFQSIFAKPSIIKQPTIIKTGAVIAGNPAIAWIIGEKKIDNANNAATTMDVKPVLPPAATPDVDSTYAVEGLVPNIDPTVVAVASANNADFALGKLPFFIKPACSATPIIVPVVSKIVTNKNANTTVYNPFVNTPPTSKSKKTGIGGVETNPVNSKYPVKKPMIPVMSIPMKRAPLTFRSEEHTSELQSRGHLVCRLLLEKKNKYITT